MNDIHPHAQFLVPHLLADFTKSGLPVSVWAFNKKEEAMFDTMMKNMDSEFHKAWVDAITIIEAHH